MRVPFPDLTLKSPARVTGDPVLLIIAVNPDSRDVSGLLLPQAGKQNSRARKQDMEGRRNKKGYDQERGKTGKCLMLTELLCFYSYELILPIRNLEDIISHLL